MKKRSKVFGEFSLEAVSGRHTLLEEASIAPDTLRKYVNALNELEEFLTIYRMVLYLPAQVDAAPRTS